MRQKYKLYKDYILCLIILKAKGKQQRTQSLEQVNYLLDLDEPSEIFVPLNQVKHHILIQKYVGHSAKALQSSDTFTSGRIRRKHKLRHIYVRSIPITTAAQPRWPSSSSSSSILTW